jgi:hypothetical protein
MDYHTLMMEEIPLVYPNNAETPRRYDVDIHKARLSRTEEETPSLKSSSYGGDPIARPLDEALPGAASVSCIKLRGQDLLVTTSALVESPNVISVALCWRKHQDALDSPIMVELDTKDLQVVTIRAFAVEDNTNSPDSSTNKFHLVLVGCQGTIVSMIFDENLFPDTERPLNVLYTKDYIPETLLSQVVTSTLQTNMIAFLSSKKHQIIMALAPLVLTIDWMEGKSAPWSETQCLEDMKDRAPLLFLTKFLLGKLEGGVLDMPPTAAVCVSSNTIDTKGSMVDLVFTLHSDASIRRWIIDPEESLMPLETTTLETERLSNPSSWSDARNSVSMCARVFGEIYALGVYIKTDTLREGVSECNIWAFDGQIRNDTAKSCIALHVPNDAVSLVNMSFLPQRQCSLSAVFEGIYGGSGQRDSTSGILNVIYPHSFFAIVGSEPNIVQAVTFDQIAMKERDRIRALSYGSIVLTEIDEEYENSSLADNSALPPSAKVDEALHKLDSMYMKYLFRPMFPRGNGTVLPPSNFCIRRALSKLIHDGVKEHGMSVELETIKNLYEWRNRDKRKSAVAHTPRKNSQGNQLSFFVESGEQSVYESFVAVDDDDDVAVMDIGEGIHELELLEEEIAAEVEAHENRWCRLLFQIWEEEQVLRTPLIVSWPENLPGQLVVRGGLTTILASADRENIRLNEEWAVALEEGSIKLLECIEADPNKSTALYDIEERVAALVSSGRLAISPQSSITEDLTSLSRWAQLKGSSIYYEQLKGMIGTISVSEVVTWVEAMPKDIGVFGGRRSETKPAGHYSQQIANSQLRHAACSCSVRAADMVRRSRLGKCILLLELAAGSHATVAAFRLYLESIAILWTSAQRLKMPDTAFRSSTGKVRFEESPRMDSPPNKRLSFGDLPSSILADPATSMTTTLDVVTIGISQSSTISSYDTKWPYSGILQLTNSFVDLVFPSTSAWNGSIRSLMPELCVLPKPKDEAHATEYPDLALRLLAPFVAFPIPEDSPDAIVARKEELSSCLLHSAQSRAFSRTQKSQMRQTACDLLVPTIVVDPNNPVEEQLLKEGLETLISLRSNQMGAAVNDLKRILQELLPNSTSIEISRLLDRGTAKDLFAPLAFVPWANFTDAERSSFQAVAKSMLRLSRLFNRLEILEMYINSRGGDSDSDDYNSDSLLQIISDTITEIENTFPEGFFNSMSEYRSIWTKKFTHSKRASRWFEAYDACFRNPKEELRERNFRLLVQDMVDCGALSELLDMCRSIGISSAHPGGEVAIDLYEIASEVLLECSQLRDVYDLRAASSDKGSFSDYQGALYALHVSQGQWRRAAQSMDFRYIHAENALRSKVGKIGVNIQAAELRDGLVVEDLVLAACGCSNAMELVKDPDHRFLVSGEFGPYGDMPLIEESYFETPQKPKRGRLADDLSSSNEELHDQGDNRLSLFMSSTQLKGRAIRSVALRSLFFDRSTDYLSSRSAFLRSFETSNIDVESLHSNGYYHYGLLLAYEWKNNFKALTGSTKPNGEDIFGRCLSLLMGDYLVPLSNSDLVPPRPSLQQLQTAIDSVGFAVTPASYIASDKSVCLSSLSDTAVRSAASELIRRLTLTYSTAETPVALDVANLLLDQMAGSGELPMWLERLLVGADAPSNVGAFAPRTNAGCKDYLGDPPALLLSYTRRGMFIEACNLVASVLNGFNSEKERATDAVSRLPEKGSIDYVPYQSIDLLWNLISIAIAKRAYDKNETARILKSRDNMEQALKKYFESMKISEAGIKSARLLQTH